MNILLYIIAIFFILMLVFGIGGWIYVFTKIIKDDKKERNKN